MYLGRRRDIFFFRDCNGVSNGSPLPPETYAAEAAAPPYQGKPAGEVGPPPDVILAEHPAKLGNTSNSIKLLKTTRPIL